MGSHEDSPITEATEAMSVDWTEAAALSVARREGEVIRKCLEDDRRPCSIACAAEGWLKGDGPYALVLRAPG